MNTVTTAYKENYTAEEVRKYAEEQLKDTDLCLISLGAYGGYITVDSIIPFLMSRVNTILRYMVTHTMICSEH